MLKNTKLLLLFICMLVLLAGCGGTSFLYKSGDTYKEDDSTFIEVQSDNVWKVNGHRDRANEYVLYKVEPTEYKSGKYTVVAISIKQQFGKSNPFLIMNDQEYYLLSPIENGFSKVQVGSSHKNSEKWEKFKEEYEQAKDKEAFLKQEGDRTSSKFVKTN